MSNHGCAVCGEERSDPLVLCDKHFKISKTSQKQADEQFRQTPLEIKRVAEEATQQINKEEYSNTRNRLGKRERQSTDPAPNDNTDYQLIPSNVGPTEFKRWSPKSPRYSPIYDPVNVPTYPQITTYDPTYVPTSPNYPGYQLISNVGPNRYKYWSPKSPRYSPIYNPVNVPTYPQISPTYDPTYIPASPNNTPGFNATTRTPFWTEGSYEYTLAVPETSQSRIPSSQGHSKPKHFSNTPNIENQQFETVIPGHITQEYCDSHFFDCASPPRVTDVTTKNGIINTFIVHFAQHLTRFSLVEKLQRKGSYGYVNFYLANSSYPTFLLIKNTKNANDPEGGIVEQIRHSKKLSQCGTIKARFDANLSGSSDQQYIFLQFMDTDLQYYRTHRLSPEKVGEIMKSIYEQINCLLENSNGALAYTDLKPHNVLAKLDINKLPVEVRLGDLGSCGEHRGKCVVTYQYYAGRSDSHYFSDNYRKEIKNKARCIPKESRVRAIRYFVGVMALELLGHKLHSNGVDLLSDIKTRYQKQQELSTVLGPFFDNMLWYKNKKLEKSTIVSKDSTRTTLH